MAVLTSTTTHSHLLSCHSAVRGSGPLAVACSKLVQLLTHHGSSYADETLAQAEGAHLLQGSFQRAYLRRLTVTLLLLLLLNLQLLVARVKQRPRRSDPATHNVCW